MGCIRMTDIVGKSLTGIVGTSVKPFTKKFFNNFIYNKKLGQYEYIFKNNKYCVAPNLIRMLTE